MVKKTLFVLFIILLFSSTIFAGEMRPETEINYESGYIIVEGMGTAPQNVSPAKAEVLARMAAKLDGQRRLLEIISGLEIESTTTLSQATVDDWVQSRLEGILTGAEILPATQVYEAGIYRLQMRLPIKDITPLVYPGPTSPTTEEPDSTQVDSNGTPPANIGEGENEASPYTGLIILADHLSIPPGVFRDIQDINGNLIFTTERSLYIPPESFYFADLQSATVRVGTNPLTVSALDIFEQGGAITLVVSATDGDYILEVLEETDVFLLSKIAVITGGSSND